MSEEIDKDFIVEEAEVGLRLDKLLTERFAPLYSRTYFQMLIADGLVTVGGEPVKKRMKLNEGDRVEVSFVLTPELDLTPEPFPLEVLYEDDDLIAVNKPPGMVVHPAPGHPNGTFVNALLYHCKEIEKEEGNFRPGIVHRLDKETSGVLVAAKNSEAHRAMVSLFAGREVDKEYLAYTVGTPKPQTVDGPIGRHPRYRKKMAVIETGKPAVTEIFPIGTFGGVTVVRAHPLTGRTHQIRVHLKEIGAPVLGDSLYGSPSFNQKFRTPRQFLHARKICFAHPKSGNLLTIEAPVPDDMLQFAKKNQLCDCLSNV